MTEEAKNPNELADRYVALWNEGDPKRRAELVAQLWSEDGEHVLQPPQEMREIAADLEMTARLEARGHSELEARAANAHQRFIAPGEYSFRRRDDVDRLDDVVKFHWEMVSGDGEVAGVGLEFLLLGSDGRIRRDYQFIVG